MTYSSGDNETKIDLVLVEKGRKFLKDVKATQAIGC